MWNTLNTFFVEQSALANFLQIGGAFIALSLAIWRGLRWIQRQKQTKLHATISEWIEGRRHNPVSAKSLRVVVVDDHPEDYPLEVLRRLGYSLAHIGHLSLSDIPSLNKYDCVLLDINGVLDEDSKRGGLEILKRLKTANGPYVVAVSSRGFDITMSEFFMLADHRLKKPIPQVEVESIIERAYANNFSAEDAARRIDECLSHGNSRPRTLANALKPVFKYLESGDGLKDVQTALGLLIHGDRLLNTLHDLEIVRRSLIRVQP